MYLDDKGRQMSSSLELTLGDGGEAAAPERSVEASSAVHEIEPSGIGRQLPNRRMRTRMYGGVGGE